MKRTHILGLIFIVVAIGAIISTVYNADTYSSFAQAMQHNGREVHIIGELVRDVPVEEKIIDNALVLYFTMKDREGITAQVMYFGAKPQDFEKSDQIVLIGKYIDDQFVASSLLLKCPSKYNPDDLTPAAFEETVITGSY